MGRLKILEERAKNLSMHLRTKKKIFVKNRLLSVDNHMYLAYYMSQKSCTFLHSNPRNWTRLLGHTVFCNTRKCFRHTDLILVLCNASNVESKAGNHIIQLSRDIYCAFRSFYDFPGVGASIHALSPTDCHSFPFPLF